MHSTTFVPALHPDRSGRRALLQALAAGALLAGAPLARAAGPAYPARAMRLVVPFPAAGSADILSRVLANALQPVLGQGLVIDNRAGGGGALGINLVAHAEPDGYTLGVTSLGPQVLLPAMGRKLPYDAAKDLTPIGFMGGMPLVIIANNKLPVQSLTDLVALAKTRPGKLSIGSSGVPGQLAIEQLKRQAGIDLLHVPYKGDAPLTADLLGGQIDTMSDTITAMLPLIKAGKVRPIAVTSARRWPSLAEVPTVAEQGFPGYVAEGWISLLAPADTPAEVVAELDRAVKRALADEATRVRFAELGFQEMNLDPAQLREFLQSESAKFKRVIETAGIKAD